ncbi:MAG: retropepsin-like domain-containing protein [Acidobacteriota bacterium]|nr:retropepsin-like domain-containing protein [Acidobacteriota bacterium]
MNIIRTLHFEGSKGEAELVSLFDSGSTYSCIHPDFAEKLDRLNPLPRPQKVETASKWHFIEINHRVNLDFYLNNLRLTDEFVVVPNLAEQAIIGALTLQKWKIKLDFETDEVITDPRVSRIILM